jgi:sterol desaturase/sphingolipid hydroxylase (fatty acid hydroxylase superfamily)
MFSAVHGVRDSLIEMGLAPAWHSAYHVLNYKVLGLIAVLVVVQALWPANREHQAWSAGLVLDFAYPVANILIMATFIWPLFSAANSISHELWPESLSGLLGSLPGWAEFVISLLVLDFMHYTSHLARHKIPWLWHFHSIHHSQVEMNPATTFRTHFLDSTSDVMILTLVYGLIGSDPAPWIYGGITSQFWNLFIHSNIRSNLGPLGLLVVSPQFHRVHHSIEAEHADRNFGDRLLVWDVLFGTAVFDRNTYPETGTHDTVAIRETGGSVRSIASAWLKQTLYPFRRITA